MISHFVAPRGGILYIFPIEARRIKMNQQHQLLQDIFNFLMAEGFLKKFPQWSPRDVQQALGIDTPAPPSTEESRHYPRLILMTDGASRGNPGKAGIGIVIQTPEGDILFQDQHYIGIQTNNFAEYTALKIGLQQVLQYHPQEVEIRMDSELVVKQILGEYKTKNPQLREIKQEIMQLLNQISQWRIVHVPRQANQLADKLANQAIDHQNQKVK